ncbi:Uncharacterised protein [Bordetella pertussis]|nr:Uncharacterised protein [Bordetella pertussis]CFP64991.1 Uncharacterised protein [Bordetella pertussis]
MMLKAHLSSTPRFLPMPGVTPRMRWMLGLELLAISSTFLDVIPYSSASSMALSDQRTTLNHCSSPWRTIGPSGSFEKSSGRMT